MSFDKTKFVSPILMGGLGNNLFQIATALKYCDDNNYPVIFGYWSSYNSCKALPNNHPSNAAGKPNPYFQPWGGWPGTDYPDFYWHNFFPQLPFFHNPDNTKGSEFNTLEEDDKYAYRADTGQGGEYVPLDTKPGQQFMGYFFNKEYWHPSRDLILKYLSFRSKYYEDSVSYLLHVHKSMSTVSLNFRLPELEYAGDKELINGLEEDLESIEWIERAINYFPDTSLFVVTSNKPQEAKRLLRERFPDKHFYFIVGSPAFQMVSSVACSHHILTSSTFSFWCCYLDPKQPMGNTIYSPNFTNRHSSNMIPYGSWECIE